MSSNLPVEVQELIGKTAIKDISPLKVETGLWQNFCSSIKDSNSLYWDKSEATIHTGDLISHPALLPSWVHDFEWHPERERKQPMELHFMIKDLLSLPLGIVTEVEIEFYDPVKNGDNISSEQKLISVSDIVDTNLGKGRYWIIEVKYLNQLDILVGKQNIQFLGYKK